MAWYVDYNSDLGFIQVVYTGRVTFNEFKEAMNKVISIDWLVSNQPNTSDN